MTAKTAHIFIYCTGITFTWSLKTNKICNNSYSFQNTNLHLRHSRLLFSLIVLNPTLWYRCILAAHNLQQAQYISHLGSCRPIPGENTTSILHDVISFFLITHSHKSCDSCAATVELDLRHHKGTNRCICYNYNKAEVFFTTSQLHLLQKATVKLYNEWKRRQHRICMTSVLQSQRHLKP